MHRHIARTTVLSSAMGKIGVLVALNICITYCMNFKAQEMDGNED